MKRHTFDALSFSFGIVFLVVAAVLWLGSFNVALLDFQWIAAGALLFIGASLLISSRKRPRDDR